MAIQDKYWHDIAWEEKKYFNDTTSTSYGNPVQARYTLDANGNIDPQYLTEEGKAHFGVATTPPPPTAQDNNSSSSHSSSHGGGMVNSQVAGFFTNVFIRIAAEAVTRKTQRPTSKHCKQPVRKPNPDGSHHVHSKRRPAPMPKRQAAKAARLSATPASSMTSHSLAPNRPATPATGRRLLTPSSRPVRQRPIKPATPVASKSMQKKIASGAVTRTRKVSSSSSSSFSFGSSHKSSSFGSSIKRSGGGIKIGGRRRR